MLDKRPGAGGQSIMSSCLRKLRRIRASEGVQNLKVYEN
jgi:hypothetical protein